MAAYFAGHSPKPEEQLDEVLAELRRIRERLDGGEPEGDAVRPYHSALHEEDNRSHLDPGCPRARTIAERCSCREFRPTLSCSWCAGAGPGMPRRIRQALTRAQRQALNTVLDGAESTCISSKSLAHEGTATLHAW